MPESQNFVAKLLRRLGHADIAAQYDVLLRLYSQRSRFGRELRWARPADKPAWRAALATIEIEIVNLRSALLGGNDDTPDRR